MDKVRAFIKDTTQNYQIYRVKGVFVVKDSPYKWVVQGVGSDDVFITQHGEWEQGEAQESRLTLIGRDVMKVCSPLENEFRKCIV
jgi:G3E family GTPase